MKIYVHNFYSDLLFTKLAHNTINRVFNIDSKTGSVTCRYNNLDFEFVFEPKLNDNGDGIHIIDFYAILKYEKSKDFLDLNNLNCKRDDVCILNRIIELLKGKKNWVILFFRTEKILSKIDVPDFLDSELDNIFEQLKDHIIVNDNFFLNKSIESLYPNFFYTFTNSFFQWNEMAGIRWFYEFKDIFKNLQKPYDIGFSVRTQKFNRKHILTNLSKEKDYNIFLSYSDFNRSPPFYKNFDEFKNLGIYFNSRNGSNDFENIESIPNFVPIGMDLFFRILSKSKMQVLDESWAWVGRDFTHQYLSEKTIGLILSEIPFISTHAYPLDILEQVLNIERHPFYDESKKANGEANKFCKFLLKFLDDFDKNYEMCLQWSQKANIRFEQVLTTENNLLEIIQKGFKRDSTEKVKLL